MTYLYVFIFCPFGRALSDTLHRQPSPLHRPDLPRAACLHSIPDRPQRVQRPGVRACVRSVVGGMPCIWHGLCCCLSCAVRPGALRAGVSTGGVYRERRGWGRSCPLIPKQIKKAFPLHAHPILTKRNVCHCASLQIFRKIQKDPFRSLECAIIS